MGVAVAGGTVLWGKNTQCRARLVQFLNAPTGELRIVPQIQPLQRTQGHQRGDRAQPIAGKGQASQLLQLSKRGGVLDLVVSQMQFFESGKFFQALEAHHSRVVAV